MAYEVTRDENDYVSVNGIVVAWIGDPNPEIIHINAKAVLEIGQLLGNEGLALAMREVFDMKPTAPKAEGASWQD